MKLKGDYTAGTAYSVGDAVRFTDGHVYALYKAAPAGTAPIDTMFWSKVDQTVEQCALMILDVNDANNESGEQHKLANNLTTTKSGLGLDARQGKALKTLIDDLTDRVAALEPPASEGGES